MFDRQSDGDLRIRRTRKMLWDALVALSDEKPFERITVSDICERAMVNRSTFYRHYEDKVDLLLRRLDEMLDEIAGTARGVHEVAADRRPDHLLRFFGLVRTYASFFRSMLGPNGIGLFSDRLVRYMIESFMGRVDQWRFDESSVLVPVELLAHYHASAALGLVKWWVDNELPCSEEELARHHFCLVAFGAMKNLGVPEPEMPAR